MSGLAALLGDKLVGKNGDVDTASELSGKSAVGIYFSAHWCPPCRGFTPKLAEFYTKNLKAKGLEIVFVSSDKDKESFNEYFGEMPWLAVPFDKKDVKEALDKKFKVQGIPTFVIVDPEGNTITTDGRSAVMEDPVGASFPWKPKTMADIWSAAQLVRGGEKVSVADAFAGKKAIGLYFSAHWCPPCRGFTPKLKEWYEKDLKAKGLEIVFVSSDKDEQSFKDYYAEHADWLALDFVDRGSKADLSKACGVEGIPTFVIIDPTTYKIINAEGREAVSRDPQGNDLPWLPKPVRDLSDGPGNINEKATVMVFCETASPGEKKAIEDALTVVSKSFIDAAGDGEPEFDFTISQASGGLANRIRSLTNLETLPPGPHEHPLEQKEGTAGGWGCDGCNQSGEGKTRFRCSQGCDFDYCGDCHKKASEGGGASLPTKMVLIDIPSDGAYYVTDGPITVDSVKTFLDEFKAGKLARQQLG